MRNEDFNYEKNSRIYKPFNSTQEKNSVFNSLRGHQMIFLADDMNQAKLWLNKTEGEMSEDQLIYLVATGFEECPDFCASKKYCEDGACACIRATFPTPDHYHLYLSLRKLFLDWTKQGIIAGSINKEVFLKLKEARRKLDENT